MDWADLFERAAEYDTDEETIRETLAAHRERTEGADTEGNDA